MNPPTPQPPSPPVPERTPTPRTDAQVSIRGCVHIAFARLLEKELYEAQEGYRCSHSERVITAKNNDALSDENAELHRELAAMTAERDEAFAKGRETVAVGKALLDELTALLAERDKLRDEVGRLTTEKEWNDKQQAIVHSITLSNIQLERERDTLRTSLSAAQQDGDALAGALEPFAEMAKYRAFPFHGQMQAMQANPNTSTDPGFQLFYRDFYRADDALKAHREGKKGRG